LTGLRRPCSREVVEVSQVKRPSRVVMVDADNPLEEVRGEFFWREDHERALAAAREAAYRVGYEDGHAAASAPGGAATVRVRFSRRPRLVFRAVMLFVVVAYLVTLLDAFLR